MDPLTLAVAGAVVTGLATKAGESAGTALAALVRRIRERFRDSPQELESQERTAAALEEEFKRDPGFREEIRELWEQARGDTVVNDFSGRAKTVVQARDISGGLTIN